MSNDFFRFKQFTVRHDKCAMKVGTDGVLLGAWAPGGKAILDIGTGTGLIALMLSQRFPESVTDAIDIDADSVAQAQGNADASPFGKRINIFHSSLIQFATSTGASSKRYDSIVSNPPFYTEETYCPNDLRNTARHTESLSYRDLFRCASLLLKESGLFSIIVPLSSKESIMYEACISGMFVKEICIVRTTPRKQPKRIMITFSKENKECNGVISEKCLMNADGSKSEWYRKLTDRFYL